MPQGPLSTRTRYQQLMAGQRDAGRRRTLRTVAALLVLLAAVITIGAAWLTVRAWRGHSRAQPTPSAKARPGKRAASARLVFSHNFIPAPQFVAADSERVYVGSSIAVAKKQPARTAVAAFELSRRDPRWQVTLPSTL